MSDDTVHIHNNSLSKHRLPRDGDVKREEPETQAPFDASSIEDEAGEAKKRGERAP
jgi:hypothetical protein